MTEQDQQIAYFSMEIGLRAEFPTYSGGLGILAGDTIRAAADMGVPLVALTLVYRKGYFFQTIDADGHQHEAPEGWHPEEFLEELPEHARVSVGGRVVEIRAWRHVVRGVDGRQVSVLLLDTDLPSNSEEDRALTDVLYGGDACYRLSQEVILGIGGIRILRAIGCNKLQRYHMNEGHASLLVLELLEEQARKSGREEVIEQDLEVIRRLCVFTTHTPVPAGHDKFPMNLVVQVLGDRGVYKVNNVFCCEGILNMTYLGLNLSHYINGVAKRHGEISRRMFSRYVIDAITNGVHAMSWAALPFAELFNRYVSDWQRDNFSLRSALGIPRSEIWAAHQRCKNQLIEFVNQQQNVRLAPEVMTLGFARRAASYKRADLLFSDLDRLRKIGRGKLQILYGGKAHPADEGGKEVIRRVVEVAKSLDGEIPVVYLENYDMSLARRLTAGVDLWLNTPEPPLEASGTSGMKAALNGVPSLSVLDGWWIEGRIEGVTGWSIGKPWRLHDQEGGLDRTQDAASLYNQLEDTILPMFYDNRAAFTEVMRHCIALNGSFFNTQRMLQQYIQKAYYA